jgi:small-conductance mechanosensitive channel
MHRPRLALLFLLALSLLVGGPAVAQQPADSLLQQTETPPPAPADSATVPSIVIPATVPATVPVPAATTPPPPAPVAAQQTDSLRAELATLRAAVLGLASQNDSLAGALAARPSRVDTVVVRDTTARANAQRTVERVGEEASKAIQNFVPKLVLSILLIIVALNVVRGLVWLLEALAARGAERRLFYKKLIPIARLLVWLLAVYLIITAIFQIPGNSLLAAAAAIGVAVGFAAQEVLKNIFGGIVIIFDQPFQVGDKVAVGGTYGEVVSIGMRSTRIVTPDDNLVSVPNSQVVADQVSNANAGELNLQVVTDLYLPGWVDVALAKRIAYAAAANSKYVYLDKPIVVIVKDEFKETFLIHLKVKAYVLDTRYEFLLMSDVTEAAKAEFLRTGLLRPMPTVDAYVDALNDANEDLIDERSGETSNGAAEAAPRILAAPQSDPPPDTA